MRQVQPALWRLDGCGAEAVLHLLDGMVLAVVDDNFVVDYSLLNARRQSPTNAAALAGLDEVVLRAGVEGVLFIDELRMQNHVALLR